MIALMFMVGHGKGRRTMTGRALEAELPEVRILMTGHARLLESIVPSRAPWAGRKISRFRLVATSALDRGMFAGQFEVRHGMLKKLGLELRLGHRMAARAVNTELTEMHVLVAGLTVLRQASVGT